MIYFLSPFYNEEEFIAKFLADLVKHAKKVPGQNYKIVLVNDGSQDRSLEIVKEYAKKYPIILISHGKNRGVDVAFKLGFKKVLSIARKNDLLVTLESDNTSDLKILPKMILKSQKGADVVLASCYAKGGGVYDTGIFRQMTSKVANLLLYFIFPIKGVKTYSSFYRLYKLSTFRKIWNSYERNIIRQKGFVCMAEMLIKMSKLPVNIQEVPMVLRWKGRRGKSKMKITRTIFGHWLLFKELFLKENLNTSTEIKKAREKWKFLK